MKMRRSALQAAYWKRLVTITIVIDPHKATHTAVAVAVDTVEAVIDEHKVRASAAQATALRPDDHARVLGLLAKRHREWSD